MTPYAIFSILHHLAWSSMASEVKIRNFDFDGQSVNLHWHTEHEGWVSPSCDSARDCEALRLVGLVRTSNLKLTAEELSGGKNPGSVLCKRLSAKVVFGQPKDGGGRTSFCQAGDGSLIPSSFLSKAHEGRSR